MKKIKILAVVVLCSLSLVGCNSSINTIVNNSIPFGSEILSCVSIANGTAIKDTNRADNQLSVVYDNGDVLTYSITVKAEKSSISFSMSYVSSEKKSVDFVLGIVENLSGEELTNDMKDELISAIENDSSAKFEFPDGRYTTKINFKQTDNVFMLNVMID